jgi:hypothetical protein
VFFVPPLFFNKWRFCSPRLNRWWLFSPIFSGLWWFGLCFFLFCFLSFGSGRKIHLKWSSLGSGRLLVSSTVCIGRIFFVFFSNFEARSTHVCQLLPDTHHPAAFPVVLRPCCRKHRSCWSSELGAWPSRTRESSLSVCV